MRRLQGPWLLFDDTQDRFETNNLVGKPEHAALVKELDAQLQAQLKRIGDDFRPGKDYHPAWGEKLESQGN